MSRLRTILLIIAVVLVAALAYSAGYAASPDSPAHLLVRDPGEWEALGTWAAVLLASVAAVIALRQAVEARQLRIDQAQAYVVAYMESNPNAFEVVEIVFKNFGATGARDINISVDRPLRTTGQSGAEPEEVVIPTAIPFLAPGQEWRTFWDFSTDRAKGQLEAEDVVHVTISYLGVEGAGRQVTNATLDWAIFKTRLFMTTKTTHHAAKALGDIASALKNMTEGAGRHLSVITRDGAVLDERRRLQFRDLRAELEANPEKPSAPESEGPDTPDPEELDAIEPNRPLATEPPPRQEAEAPDDEEGERSPR